MRAILMLVGTLLLIAPAAAQNPAATRQGGPVATALRGAAVCVENEVGKDRAARTAAGAGRLEAVSGAVRRAMTACRTRLQRLSAAYEIEHGAGSGAGFIDGQFFADTVSTISQRLRPSGAAPVASTPAPPASTCDAVLAGTALQENARAQALALRAGGQQGLSAAELWSRFEALFTAALSPEMDVRERSFVTGCLGAMDASSAAATFPDLAGLLRQAARPAAPPAPPAPASDRPPPQGAPAPATATAQPAPAQPAPALTGGPRSLEAASAVLAIAVLCIPGAVFVLLLMGLGSRVVIYEDEADLIWTAAMLVLPFMVALTVAVVASVETNGRQPSISPSLLWQAPVTVLTAAAGVSLWGWSVVRTLSSSIRCNGPVLGGLVWLTKIIGFIAIIFALIGSLYPKTARSRIFLFTLFAWWAARLINGERVAHRRELERRASA